MIPSLRAYGLVAALLAVWAGGRAAVRFRRWWAEWRSEREAWLAETGPAYAAEVEEARARAADVVTEREVRAESRLSDVAALRPWHGPASDRHR